MAERSEVRITLSWTSPGDDGWIGRAKLYDVRVSRSPIDESNFHRAGKVAGFVTPSVVGRRESMVVTGLTPGVDYYFAVRTRDEAGNWSKVSNLALWSDRLSVAEPTAAATSLEFSAPRPNPARSQTRFTVTLPARDAVRVEVYDLTGRRVRTLAAGEERAGEHELAWNLSDDAGRRVPVGIYLVRAQIGTTSFTRRVSVMR